MAWQELITPPPAATEGPRSNGDGQFWVDRLEELSRTLDAHLSDPTALGAVAEAVVDMARRENATAIVPASEAGMRLVDAARSRAAFADDLTGKTVLVVDGLLVSGAHLLQAARTARSAGASRVVGLTVVADSEALESTKADLGDALVAIDVRDGSHSMR